MGYRTRENVIEAVSFGSLVRGLLPSPPFVVTTATNPPGGDIRTSIAILLACSTDGCLTAGNSGDGNLHCFDATFGIGSDAKLSIPWTKDQCHSHTFGLDIPPPLADGTNDRYGNGSAKPGPIRSLSFSSVKNGLLLVNFVPRRPNLFDAALSSLPRDAAGDVAWTDILCTLW